MGIEITLSDLEKIYSIIPENYRIPITFTILIIIISYKYRYSILACFKAISPIIDRFLNFGKLLPHLWRISVENSQNYRSMIGFNIDLSIFQNHINTYKFIDANVPSPYFKFKYFIRNYSIFDFKIKKIDMQIRYQNDDLGSPVTAEGLDLPHQETIYGEAKLERLHPNFIDKLRIEIKGKEKLLFEIQNVNIFLTGDKEFEKPCGNFILEIPIKRINVSE